MLVKDLSAGVVVGIVALPLAIAFAIASGVRPDQGLITAVIAGFLISALGGSRFQIGGPTGAFVILVYSVIQQHGMDGLIVATIMAGVMLMVMGVARLGAVLRFIPYPVTVGFTSGIAIVIAVGQVGDALGLTLTGGSVHMSDKVAAIAQALPSIDPLATMITLATIAIILVTPRILPNVPGSLLAIVATTTAVALMGTDVETVGSRFGEVSATIPSLRLPQVTWDQATQLFAPALSIAILAGIESLLSAVVADGMTGRRHRSNTELIAQGVANIASPLFGGIPATGAIARTATNVKSGAVSPVSGMIHAAVLLVIFLTAGPLAAKIPLATLAGILLVVAYNMSELHLFAYVLRSTRSDAMVMVATFLLTVVIDLTVAIQAGVVLAAFLFMKRMADVANVRAVTGSTDDDDTEADVDPAESALLRGLPPGIEIFEINGPFFFGAAHKFQHALSEVQRTPLVIVLRMRHVLALDATGLRVLEESAALARKGGPRLLLADVHMQPLVVMERSGFLDRIGREHVPGSLAETLEVAARIVLGEAADQ